MREWGRFADYPQINNWNAHPPCPGVSFLPSSKATALRCTLYREQMSPVKPREFLQGSEKGSQGRTQYSIWCDNWVMLHLELKLTLRFSMYWYMGVMRINEESFWKWCWFLMLKKSMIKNWVLIQCSLQQFAIAKTWKQPQCPPTEGRSKKLWYVY